MRRFYVYLPGEHKPRYFDNAEDAQAFAGRFGPIVRIIDHGHYIPKELHVIERSTKSPNLLCFIEQFPLAMAAIAETHDYSRGPLVKGDYRPSLLRHLFKLGEHPDHDAAVAWNAIAHLEMKLRQGREGAGE